MRLSKLIFALLLISSGCVVENAEQGSVGGDAFVMGEDGTFQLDPNRVPVVMSCAEGEFVRKTVEGWDCASTPMQSVDWKDLSGKPAGFDDDVDDDLLASLSCADGERAAWSEANGAWECQPDSDQLASLDCADGEVAAWSSTVSAWQCAGVMSAAGGDVTAVVAGTGLLGGADSGSATLNVDFGDGTDQAARGADLAALQTDVDAVENTAGSLQASLTSAQSNISTLQSDVSSVETDVGGLQSSVQSLQNQTTLSDLSGCSSGDVPQSDGAGGWACGEDATLDGPTHTSYLMVSAHAFFPINSADGWTSPAITGNSRWTNGTTMAAPVYLPNGAEILSLFCRITENSSTRSLRVFLRQTRPGLSNDEMVAVTTGPNESDAGFIGGTNGDLLSNAVDPVQNTVNTQATYYYNLIFQTYSDQSGGVTASCGSNCQIGLCKITYRVTDPYP